MRSIVIVKSAILDSIKILSVVYTINITDNRLERIGRRRELKVVTFLFVLITFLKITYDYYVVYVTRQI